ncbi:flagellar export chaperone FliS [Candidatus Endobugula sertula]|uniref:Flagellar export chaperone FliS n=1 Tax=Candidatus Endobugula sertula TaxID=62101 RepID=A0A1D2QT36_9GAMM|nr:flagellar export chaperone FliS [Candidatus Endobugula sertula]
MSATVVNNQTTDIESVTPYQVITLLLSGALERIDQAITNIGDGEIDAAALLVQKTMAIVAGLRESLDLSQGGDIAVNLDALYEYILARLEGIGTDEPIVTLNEVKSLLQEVHAGWEGISDSVKY